jgi:hypothetical protein
MFDKYFIQEMGMENMPEEKVNSLVELAMAELERRVGQRLLSEMGDIYAQEYLGLENEDAVILEKLLDENGDYVNDPAFIQIKKGVPEGASESLAERIALKEYLKVKLLEKAVPNFRETVKFLADNIKRELIDNKDRILYSML